MLYHKEKLNCCRPGKYNEYSNVIRVDSTRLKEARLRSLSRPNLAEGAGDNKKDKGSKLRKAISMEGGLDKKQKKSKKDKKAKGADEEGEKKPKKPFLLKSFKDLFGSRRKKAKDEKEQEGEEENVYEVVEDSPERKSKYVLVGVASVKCCC